MATPTPIPAFAPVLSDWLFGGGDDGGDEGSGEGSGELASSLGSTSMAPAKLLSADEPWRICSA